MAKGGKSAAAGDESSSETISTSALARPMRAMQRLKIEGYAVEGISVAGDETCIIFPSLNLAFDIGCCLPLAISQEFLFVSHAHMDHIGDLHKYVGKRKKKGMRPPTVFVPSSIADLVRRQFDVVRAMDQSGFEHKLVPLEVGEEYELGNDLRVRAFKTYHVVPSQVTNDAQLESVLVQLSAVVLCSSIDCEFLRITCNFFHGF